MSNSISPWQLLAAAVALAACDSRPAGPASAGAPTAVQSPAHSAPPATPAVAPADGAAEYSRRCAPCHGLPGGVPGRAAGELERAVPPLDRHPEVLAGRWESLLVRLRQPGPRMHLEHSHPSLPAIARFLCTAPPPAAPSPPRLSGADQPGCDRCHGTPGEEIIEQVGCGGCHPATGLRGARFAPDLTGAGTRFHAEFLVRFLTAPHNRRQHGVPWGRFTRMPDFALSEGEVADLAAWLLSLRQPLPPPPPAPVRAPLAVWERGRQLVDQRGCLDCHRIGSRGGRLGPDLSGAGTRLRPDWLFAWLSGPRALQPDTSMPDPALDPDERHAVVAYLMAQTAPSLDHALAPAANRPMGPVTGSAARGARLASALRCLACHPLQGTDPPPRLGPAVSLDWAGLRLSRDALVDWLDAPQAVRRGGPARMPRFRLTGPERISVADALAQRAARHAPQLAEPLAGGDATVGARHYEEQRCASCHGERGSAPLLPSTRLRPRFAFHALAEPGRFLPQVSHPPIGKAAAAHLARFVARGADGPPPEPHR